jgi:hypothetical protein
MSSCVAERSNCSAPIGFQVWPLVAAVQLHQVYGNLGDLHVLYPSLLAYVALLDQRSATAAGMAAVERGLGEWMPAESPATPLAITGRGFLQMSYARFARVAALLGHAADARWYRARAAQTAARFNADFFDHRDGTYRVNETCTAGGVCTAGYAPFDCPSSCGGGGGGGGHPFHPPLPPRCPCYTAATQCGQALPLFLGIAPNPALALQRLHENLITNGNAMLVGMQCVEPFFTVLSDGGLVDLAFASVMRTEFPGYGYMLRNNATTLWEDMRLDDEGHSHNHPMFGAVDGWMVRVLGGIRPHPNASGFDRALIAVRPPHGLHQFSATYDSVRGRVQTSWRWATPTEGSEAGGRDGNGDGDGAHVTLQLNVTIPPGMQATVEVPSHSGGAEVAVSAADSGHVAALARAVADGRWRAHLACGPHGCGGVRSVELGSGTYQIVSRPTAPPPTG